MATASSQEFGSNISTNGTTVLKAERDVNARQATVDAGDGLLSLQADRDINIEAGEAKVQGSYSAQWKDKKTFSRTDNKLSGSFDNTTSVGSRFSGGMVSMGAKNDINIVGSSISGKEGVAVVAGHNLTVVDGRSTSNASAELDQRKRGISALGAALGFVMPSGKATTTGIEIKSDVAAPSTITSSKGGILLQGDNGVFLQGVQVDAAKDVSILGGNVVVQAAANQQSVTGTTSSKSAWYDFGSMAILKDVGKGIKARENTATEIDTTTLTRTNINGANVSIAAADTLALAGTTIDSPGKVSLSADTLLMGTQTTETTTRTTSQGRDMVYQVMRDNGRTDQTTNYNQINAGSLSVTANRVQAGLGARDSIEALSRQPGMGWVNQLASDPKLEGKIDWQKVDEVHKNWDYDKQGLTPEGAAIVSLVVSYLSWGTAQGLGQAVGDAAATSVTGGIAALGEGGFVAAGGMTLSTAVGGAVAAGITALASQASVALINNQGDIGAALRDLGSSANVKNLLTAIATGGVLGSMNLNPTGAPTLSGGAQPFVDQLRQNLTAGAARAVIGTAINGGSFEKNLKDSLKNAILDTVAAQAANAIGDLTRKDGVLDDFTNKVAHAIAGCMLGAVRADNSGGCGAGALGAAIGEFAAEAYGRRADTTQFAALISGLAVAITGGDAAQINLGSQAGSNAAANNYLNHTEAALRERLKDKQRLGQSLTEAERSQLNGIEILDIARDLALRDACKTEGDACNAARRGLNAAISSYSSGANAMTDASLSAAANAAVSAERDQIVALANDPALASQTLLDSFKEFAVPQATGYVIGGALGAYIREARIIYSAIQAERESIALIQQAANARALLPLDIQGRGNMGVANIEIPGVQPKMTAFSRIDDPTPSQRAAGFVGEVPETFASSTVPTDSTRPFLLNRSIDSEAKILNNIAVQLGENTSAKGVVNLFTERAPCLSCSQQAARCTYQELKRQALSAYYDFSRDEVEKNNPSHLRVLARLNHHFEGTLGCPIEELMFCVVELVLSGGLHVEVEQNCREWIKLSLGHRLDQAKRESDLKRNLLAAAMAAGPLLTWAQQTPTTPQPFVEQQRQQERERALREQNERTVDQRPQATPPVPARRIPESESPCFRIDRIVLTGEQSDAFQWAVADLSGPEGNDSPLGRCLGTAGVNVVLARAQQAVIARGFVTSRVLAAPQDLSTSTLTLSFVPGRIA
ncbi:unnamed protein product, partial [Brugia timori]|uniref:Hemagglutinin n=1 Tax=Brugia timori TaxID=42155 RepID=A0A0R3Q5B6_9BILA